MIPIIFLHLVCRNLPNKKKLVAPIALAYRSFGRLRGVAKIIGIIFGC